MPRRAGVAGIGHGIGARGLQAQNAARERAQDVGEQLVAHQKKQLAEQCVKFKDRLEEFASKHKQDIIRDPQFRSKFNEMCSSIGVDPLASKKGLWGALGMGEFYYELGVQLVQLCLERRRDSGGLDRADELLVLLEKRRGAKAQKIDIHDIEQAVRNLQALGKSLEIITLPGEGVKLVQSVPCELSRDHTTVIESARRTAHTSVPILMEEFAWPQTRASAAIEFLLDEGMAWVDAQNGAPFPLIWFPSLFPPQSE